jgi:hypothetical protein
LDQLFVEVTDRQTRDLRSGRKIAVDMDDEIVGTIVGLERVYLNAAFVAEGNSHGVVVTVGVPVEAGVRVTDGVSLAVGVLLGESGGRGVGVTGQPSRAAVTPAIKSLMTTEPEPSESAASQEARSSSPSAMLTAFVSSLICTVPLLSQSAAHVLACACSDRGSPRQAAAIKANATYSPPREPLWRILERRRSRAFHAFATDLRHPEERALIVSPCNPVRLVDSIGHSADSHPVAPEIADTRWAGRR